MLLVQESGYYHLESGSIILRQMCWRKWRGKSLQQYSVFAPVLIVYFRALKALSSELLHPWVMAEGEDFEIQNYLEIWFLTPLDYRDFGELYFQCMTPVLVSCSRTKLTGISFEICAATNLCWVCITDSDIFYFI